MAAGAAPDLGGTVKRFKAGSVSGRLHSLPELARLYPRFEVLSADAHFEADTRALYGDCRRSLDEDWRFERPAGAAPAGAPAAEGEGRDG